MRTVPVALILITFLIAPTVSGSHWATYYELDDEYVARTLEPDHERVDMGGNPFHGIENRVSLVGHEPGDGTLFLDARAGTQVGPATDYTGQGFAAYGTTVFAGGPGGTYANRPELLLPGPQHVAAWYGEWNDFANPGVIDDLHDSNCGDACPADEFRWRGLATGETVPVAMFVVPVSYGFPFPGNFAAFGKTDRALRTNLLDRTELSNPEQGWTGGFTTTMDGGLLTEITTIVIADATPRTGTIRGFDLEDGSGLVDVDVYESLSGDVETLYLATARLVQDTNPDGFVTTLTAYVRDHTPAIVNETRDDVNEARASDPYQESSVIPPDPKEPSTPFDDFEGRAEFGGIGGRFGPHNSYTGYLDSYHLYFDAFGREHLCTGFAANVPTTSIGTAQRPVCSDLESLQAVNADLLGGSPSDTRKPVLVLTFEAAALLWFDRNADTHIGDVCDTSDPDDFDAERNTCRRAPYPWPHHTGARSLDGEAIVLCDEVDAIGLPISVVADTGEFGRAYVIRNTHELGAHAPEVTVESLEGRSSVDLWWQPDCVRFATPQDPFQLRSRDALVFLDEGARPGLTVTTHAFLDEYKLGGTGISIENEAVTDVDVYPGAL